MFPQFDPSKMDPKTLMELSRLVQTLPPDMINRMQQIMHNAMAGFDVKKDMEEFERQLPAGFREKLTSMMAGQMGALGGFTSTPTFGGGPTVSTQGGSIHVEPASSSADANAEDVAAEPSNLRDARLTILRAVADGRMSPEEAERVLFA